MGAFSWCTSDTQKSIPCCMPFGDLPSTVYLLNPFGEPYKESYYEGYGVFGGRDAYELVVEWNREYLTSDNIHKPERHRYAPGKEGTEHYNRAFNHYLQVCAALAAYAAGASDEFMKENYGELLSYGVKSEWKRCLGIQIACYEENHVKLRYPIKIVEHPMEYEKAGISPSCPYQGCIYPDSMAEIRRGVRKAFARLTTAEEKWKGVCQGKEPLAKKIQTASKRVSEPAGTESKTKAAEHDR